MPGKGAVCEEMERGRGDGSPQAQASKRVSLFQCVSLSSGPCCTGPSYPAYVLVPDSSYLQFHVLSSHLRHAITPRHCRRWTLMLQVNQYSHRMPQGRHPRDDCPWGKEVHRHGYLFPQHGILNKTCIDPCAYLTCIPLTRSIDHGFSVMHLFISSLRL